MVDPGSLALRLSDATDVASAAERLAEHCIDLAPGGAVRIWLLGPGDRCAACVRARDCSARDRCLHLEAGIGSFARPPGSVDRIPRTDGSWMAAIEGRHHDAPVAVPNELEAPAAGHPAGIALLLPLVAAGGVVGVLGIRCPDTPNEETRRHLREASLLGAATFRLLRGLAREHRRNQQMLLVSDLGRKVNSILDDDLLLRQAAVDIQRTFGFHNVMVFMRESDRDETLHLKAQASTYAAPQRQQNAVTPEQGVVGRAFRRGATEIVADVTKDPDFVAWYPDTMAEIAVPIQIGGVTEGVLNVESDRVGGLGDAERLVLETVANQLAIAVENARLFAMVKEREDRYRVLVESNPGAVLHLDARGAIVFANPAAADLTGRPKEDLLSRSTLLLELADAESCHRLEGAIDDAIRGTPRRDVEFQVEHADGSVRYVQASFQPLLGEAGDAHGVVVLARDRTRERELQDRLYQSEKLSAIGGLVSGVAHELNNPLAGILGFAQLLLSRPTEEWARGDVEKIEKNARRCQHIVENLLAFARQARLSKRLANLNEIIDSVLRLNEYQFHVDDIEVQRDLDLRLPPMHLDVNRWQQVFVNLASNAHQAMVAAHSPKRVLRFETRLRDGQAIARVCDTGPGIPTEKRARVFEPFFTTKEAGTGLGLGICYGIVTEHGGTIELEPAAGDGTCFRITLPMDATAPSQATAPEGTLETGTIPDAGEMPDAAPDPVPDPVLVAGGDGETDPGTRTGQRVLVVDDEDYVRDVVVRALKRYDFLVDAACDGLSALECVAERTYDAVLCDVSMPGEIKGIDLYDRIHVEHPEIARRFIFITGHVHDDALTAELNARGGRCVEKPFDIHYLARMVSEVANGGDDG